MQTLAIIFISFFYTLFLVLAIIDLKKRIVPNKIVYPAIIIGLTISPLWFYTTLPRTFFGISGIWACFASSLCGGVLLMLIFLLIAIVSRGGMGGGDVKLAALIGVAIGLTSLPMALLITTVSLAIVVIPLLLFRAKSRTDAIPFAPFLCIGGTAALVWGMGLTRWVIEFAQR